MRTPPNERLTPDIVDAPRSRDSGSERRCILSGETRPREELLRLAISPEGHVLPDPGAKAPGRGAWIAPDRQALENALSDGQFRRALARAFKGAEMQVSDDLAQQIETALIKALTNRLGLELRAGNVVLGSGRIGDEARAGRLAMLLHSADASEDGRKKLDQAWRVGRMAEGSGERGTVLPLDRAALSVALGRDNVVHLGVYGIGRASKAAERTRQAVQRVLDYIGCAKDRESEGTAVPADHQAAESGEELNT